eukprot:13104587-Alexandrium_andersonii.AAC.1
MCIRDRAFAVWCGSALSVLLHTAIPSAAGLQTARGRTPRRRASTCAQTKRRCVHSPRALFGTHVRSEVGNGVHA